MESVFLKNLLTTIDVLLFNVDQDLFAKMDNVYNKTKTNAHLSDACLVISAVMGSVFHKLMINALSSDVKQALPAKMETALEFLLMIISAK